MPGLTIEVRSGISDQVLAHLKQQIGNLDGVVGVLSESTKKLAKQQAAAEKEFRSVAASLDPVIRAQQGYDRSTRALDEALKRNIITEAEHNRLLGIAKTRYNEASTASVSFGQRAEKSIGGLLTNLGRVQFLIGGLGMLASGLGLGAAIEEAREAEREIVLLDAQIKNLPATSSITAALVQEHARQIGEAFAFDGEEVIRAERALIRYGVTSDSVLGEAARVSANVARALGIGLTEAAQMVGKALQEPGEGMKALKQAGLMLSDSQIALAQHLAETGQQAEAQRVVIGSLGDEVEGVAAAYRDSFDGSLAAAQISAADLAETVGLALLPGLEKLLNTFTEIANNPLVARNLSNVGETLGGIATGASKALGYLDRLNAVLNKTAGFDLGDVYAFLDPLHLEILLSSIEATDELADAETTLAAAVKKTADAERERGAAARASREEEAQTIALSRKSHADMVEITARWGKETATLTAGIEREDKAIQDLFDSIDPLGKALREAGEKNELLERRFAAGLISADAYAAGLAEVAYQLGKVRAASELTANDVPEMPVERDFFRIYNVADDIQKQLDAQPPRIDYVEVTGGAMTELEVAFDEAATNFSQNLEGGMVSAGETFFVELANGEEDALQNFGEGLKQMFIQSIAEYLSKMLVALAKELAVRLAMAAKVGAANAAANQAGGGGGGGMGGMLGGLGSLFGGGASGGTGVSGSVMGQGSIVSSGGGGAAAGVGAFAGFMVVLAGIFAVLKHQDDREKKYDYGTKASVDVNNGGVSASSAGKLSETGNAIAAAMADVISGLQEATGLWITGTAEAEIAIRNDKQGFYVKINDVIIGNFHTAQEAIMAAAKKMFSDGSLSGVLDERIARVIDHFRGTDFSELIEQVKAVQGIIDEVSGLTEIELAIRNLPAQTAALTAELSGMGLSLADSTELAAQWQAKQYQNLRDQITGHQQTEAEQMAQKQREAAMFNANVTLDKARIASEIAVLEAKIGIAQGANALDNSQLNMQYQVLASKADLIEDEFKLENGRLVGIAATNEIQRQLLEEQLAALNIAKGYLDSIDLIDPGEIRLGGGHGGRNRGGGNAGPSPAEQRATAFNDFIENMRLDGLTEMQRRIEELNKAFAEQAEAAGEVAGGEELLAAARAAAFAKLRADFLEGYRVAGLSEYQRGLEELNRAFAEQALLNPELVGGEEELAAVRAAAAAQLREGLLDSFGSPLEALRDLLADTKQKFVDLAEANRQLALDFRSGAITAEEYAAAIAHGGLVVGEFNDQMRSELMTLALYFTDAMGDIEASARIRAELAELEWDLKKAEMRMTLQAAWAVHAISDATYRYWMNYLYHLSDDLPGGTDPGTGGTDPGTGGNDDSGQDDLLRAHEDLINALEDLADLQRDLWASNLSPLNAEQQTAFLGGEIQDAYAQAMASGDAGDVRAFQDLVRDYLSSYQDAYGSTGGYSEEFLRINALINDLLGLGGMGGVVPGPGWQDGPGGTGTGGWRQTPGGQGNVLPFERSGGPNSPFVVESPALTAIAALTRETNQRLEAVERRLGMIHTEAQNGNRQAAARAFMGRGGDGPVGLTGAPRRQKRGA